MFNLDALNTPRLVGRDDVLQSLHAHLTDGVIIMSLRESVGVGATTLARRLATEVTTAYPDGCIEINLRGSIAGGLPQTEPEHIHRRVLMMLNPESDPPEEPGALRKQYMEMLAERKVVLILDDVASAVQLRALLPRSGSTAIVTSQSDLSSSFPRLHAVTLGDLLTDDAYHLMVQGAPEATSLSRRAVRQISERLEGIPLALRIAASLVGMPNQLTPRKLLYSLEHARQRILALRGSQTPITPIDIAIEVSYDLLDFEMKQTFEALAVFPAPFTRSAAAAVWQVTGPEAKDSLEQLSNLALVDHHAASALYEVHPRVRIFAQELLLGQPKRSEELVSRYVGHYLRTAVQTSAAFFTLTPRNRNEKLDPYTIWEHIPIAWSRLNGEAPGWPKPPDMDRWIRDFPLHSRSLLRVLLSRTEHRDWLSLALSAAEAESNPHTLSAHLGALGQAYADMEEHDVALTYFERQIAVAQDDEARDLEAEALMYAGSSYAALNQGSRAGDCWRKALELFELLNDHRAERVRLWLEQLENRPES